MTDWSVVLERLIVNTAAVVPALPSITLTSSIETVGCVSSFEIVPTP